MFLSTISTYNSTNPFAAILLVFFTSLIVISLIPIIFRHRNWQNAPPGPYGWPIFGYLPYLYGGSLHVTFFNLSKTYGPFYCLRVGKKPTVVITSPDIAREILKHKDGFFSSRTITEAVRCITYNATSCVFVPYSERWRLLRKIFMTELFSSRAIQLLQPARQQQVHILLKSLYGSSKSKTVVNISQALLVATTNLTSNLVCSKSLFGNIEVRELLNGVFAEVFTPNLADFVPFMKMLDIQGIKRRLTKVAKKMDSAFDKLIDERLEEKKNGIKINENGRLDLLDVFLDYKIEGNDNCFKRFSRDDIKGMFVVSMLL
ncbi:hypothetical protein NE237_014068 [Protea cynaroides]|uniref:Cytochrome P450 n=1 Tax=Protea cynaroides TaxID=273540 RepID=A0A9Q0H128_9MAGN|nr:hypothetical protein NE237_014068 [Protea cynaroides]